jgi:dihydrofolate synthase/folylpolyglutamate synthase
MPAQKNTPRKKVSTKKRTPAAATATRSRSRTKSASSTKTAANTHTYANCLRWLYEHTDYERMRMVRYNPTVFNLERMRRLLKALGNPEKQLKCVHIAGSKGKGSTCAMLESMLRACGYTVGLYSSPHLVDIRERMQINGQMISQSDFADIVKRLRTKIARTTDKPTFFEILTAVALTYFAEQAVDIVVLETGLGGRLDATNVVTPLVTGITEISLDHTNILGKSLPAIAAEKAGIFKKNVPAVSVEQPAEVTASLRAVAEQAGAPLQFTGPDIEFSYRFEANRELGPHTRVCITIGNTHYEHLAVPLQGEHQALNCGLALAILDKLREAGFATPKARSSRAWPPPGCPVAWNWPGPNRASSSTAPTTPPASRPSCGPSGRTSPTTRWWSSSAAPVTRMSMVCSTRSASGPTR